MTIASDKLLFVQFAHPMQRLLDAIQGDENCLQGTWKDAICRARKEHNKAFVKEIIDRTGKNYDEITRSIGLKSKASITQAKQGDLSLPTFQKLADLYGHVLDRPPAVEYPPRSERVALATMRTMQFLRDKLQTTVEVAINRARYEWVRRLSRCRAWFECQFRCRNPDRLDMILAEVGSDVEAAVGESAMSAAQVALVMEEWAPAYLVCVNTLNDFGVG